MGTNQKLTAQQKSERIRAAQERERKEKERREAAAAHEEDIHHRRVRHPRAGVGHPHRSPRLPGERLLASAR